MEWLWNVVHWVVYKVITKSYLCWLKIDPITNYVYKTEWAKKRFEKMGKLDPVKEVKFALTDKRVGSSSYYAGLFVIILPIVFLISIDFIYWAFFSSELQSLLTYVGPILLDAILSFIFNYFLLFRKDKYVRYFKKFEKQPREWKVKWAWISAGVILFPFVLLVGVLMVI